MPAASQDEAGLGRTSGRNGAALYNCVHTPVQKSSKASYYFFLL